MPTTHYHPAHLSRKQLETLLELERDLGRTVVALESEFQLAELDETALARVKRAEDTLGVVLVAYDRD